MITIQISTPNKFKEGGNNYDDDDRPSLKPSKSSIYLSSKEYQKYFTMEGRTSKFHEFLPVFDLSIVISCLVCYCLSAISSNISKIILKDFNHPTSLTEFQFLISSLICLTAIFIIQFNKNLIKFFPVGTLPKYPTKPNGMNEFTYIYSIIKPTNKIISKTLPMGIFQFIGHITSHKSIALIPVSLVHSIKALSPISTVFAYRLIFNVKYDLITYITLIPLMTGVILTCFSGKRSRNVENGVDFFKGLLYAFISMVIFVSQNIFAKKILEVKDFNKLPINKKDENEDEKIDKITILLYCSIFGFLLTLPIYLISELTNSHFTVFEINLNILSLLLIHGVSHFIQSMIAFHLIGTMSPVNYSVANILKRIVVISIAILVEREKVSKNQGFGLLLTMIGLYAYDKWGITKK